jgi:hypothetical protein
MDIETLSGLPAHPLVVHAAVVLLPLAALGLVAVAAVPRWRRTYAPLVLALSIAALGAVWLATETGESLQERVTETALVERHAELAEQVLPWAIAVLVVAGAVILVDRLRSERWRVPRPVTTVGLVVLAMVAGTGATWKVIEVGHSGAKATWNEVSHVDGG